MEILREIIEDFKRWKLPYRKIKQKKLAQNLRKVYKLAS